MYCAVIGPSVAISSLQVSASAPGASAVGQGHDLGIRLGGDTGPLERRGDRLLGPLLEGGEHPHLGGPVGVAELVGDRPEQRLAQDLALVGLRPQLRQPVVGREDVRGGRSPCRCPRRCPVTRPTLSPPGWRRCCGRAAADALGSVVAPMATVLMPLPACDFDPTEAAVSWQVLSAAGHDVVFATPSGQPGGPTTSW